MKNALLVIIGLAAGGLAGFFGGSVIGTGFGAGIGIATGVQAGACLAVEAAREKGMISADQVGQIFQAVSEGMKSGTSTGEDANFAGGDAECRKVVEKIRTAESSA